MGRVIQFVEPEHETSEQACDFNTDCHCSGADDPLLSAGSTRGSIPFNAYQAVVPTFRDRVLEALLAVVVVPATLVLMAGMYVVFVVVYPKAAIQEIGAYIRCRFSDIHTDQCQFRHVKRFG